MKVSRALLTYCVPEFKDDAGNITDIGPGEGVTLEVQEGFLLILGEGVIKRMVPLAQVIWVEP